jgi:hypothetical protein
MNVVNPVMMQRKKEMMIKIAYHHKEEFTTMEHWDEFAREKHLPFAITYHRYFGSWNKAKLEVKSFSN